MALKFLTEAKPDHPIYQDKGGKVTAVPVQPKKKKEKENKGGKKKGK